MRRLIVILLSVSLAIPAAQAGPRITSIVDGDTIRLGKGKYVRLLQIDTPEMQGDECYAKEAQKALANFLNREGKVKFVADSKLDEVDQYGRLLRYIFVGKRNINLEMVKIGAAAPYFYRGERSQYSNQLLAAAQSAQASGLGLWGACPGTQLNPNRALATLAEELAPPRLNSFDQLAGNEKAITYWAWRAARDQIKSASQPQLSINSLLGPNSYRINEDYRTPIINVAKLYSKFPQPKLVNIIHYNFQDRDWAQKTYESFNPYKTGQERATQAWNYCKTETTCWGGGVDNDENGEAIIFLAQQRKNQMDSNFTSGTVEAHEYTHNVQMASLWSNGRNDRTMPSWFWEGMAQYSQAAATFYDDLYRYTAERRRVTMDLVRPNTIYDEKWIEKFLSSTSGDWNYWRQFETWRLYDVGAHLCEILVAVKGINSLGEMLTAMSNGRSYEEAFQSIYGVSWGDALPKIARAIPKIARYQS
jgi:endonuclease YncB( thermonuclease family)